MAQFCDWIDTTQPELVCKNCGRPQPMRPGFRLPFTRTCRPIVHKPERRPGNAQRATAVDLPCIHRGPAMGSRECELCGYRGRLEPVYQCALHGECTASRWSSRSKGAPTVCLTCADRAEDAPP